MFALGGGGDEDAGDTGDTGDVVLATDAPTARRLKRRPAAYSGMERWLFRPCTWRRASRWSTYPLRVYRIRYAQFPQPPGSYSRLPNNTTPQAGLFVAGEWER